jgi:prepilin-type N-terminal cleavage/methylation domain-containing protein
MSRKGFSLVELLVVVGIVGGLVGLLMPAVQSARESARRAQCSNNLRQLGLAALGLELSHGVYPTGGWGWDWVGDGDRGFGREQPGSWLYSLLPFMEQGGLHSMASDGQSDVVTDVQRSGAGVVLRTPLTLINYPTRRSSSLFPGVQAIVNASSGGGFVRSDYAGNSGAALAEGPGPVDLSSARSYGWSDLSSYGGVIYLRSEVRVAQIRDGVSNTYLLGEKYLNPDHYRTGLDFSDNENAYSGNDNDNLRSCWVDLSDVSRNFVPMGDVSGVGGAGRFGSAHVGAAYFVFCDGSVRAVGFDVDSLNHYRMGHRRDGGVVEVP